MPNPWSQSVDQVFESMGVTREGLTQDQVTRRIAEFGLNELAQQHRANLLERFVSKLLNPLILILLFAAAISAFLGQISDFFIIVAITMLSIVIDVYQEHR